MDLDEKGWPHLERGREAMRLAASLALALGATAGLAGCGDSATGAAGTGGSGAVGGTGGSAAGAEFVLFEGSEGSDTDTVKLFRAPLDGSAAPALLAEAPPEEDNFGSLSPDGRFILLFYEEGEEARIRTVRTDDGTTAEVLPSGFQFLPSIPLAWRPDGERLAFVVTTPDTFDTAVYSVSPDGSAFERVTMEFFDQLVLGYAPVGDRLWYAVGDGLFIMNEGSGPVQLAGGPVPNKVSWSPDGSRIAWWQDGDVFSSLPDGTGQALVSGGTPTFFDFFWSPDGASIGYRTDDGLNSEALFAASPDGSSRVQLNRELVRFGDIDGDGWAWSPDGSKVVYIAPEDPVTENGDLFSVNPDGTSRVRINGDIDGFGEVEFFQWAPDSRRVLYFADEADGGERLRIVNVDGTARTVLDRPGDGNGLRYGFTPDSAGYLASFTVDGEPTLYVLPSDGGSAIAVSTGLDISGGLGLVGFNRDGSRVLYRVSRPGMTEIFSARLDGSSIESVSRSVRLRGGIWLVPESRRISTRCMPSAPGCDPAF